jgi:hypothetical protein
VSGATTARYSALLILAVLAGAAAVAGYTLKGPKWGVHQVPYYVNPANIHMSDSAALAAIQAGAAAWSMQTNADILPYYMGRTSGSSITKNGKNEVFFRNVSTGLYGETYWWADSSNRLIETDIVFYDGSVTFLPSGTSCSRALYLEDAAAHEFGHFLGLGHSSVTSATMYKTMGWCSTDFRTLDPDDVAGIEKLYPPGGTNTAPTVSITSPGNGSTFAEGTSITFAGSASDKEDGNLSSSLIWKSNLDGQIGTGATFARKLSVGSHTVTATVTDSRGLTGSRQIGVSVAASTSTVSPTPASGITLSGRPYKIKGEHHVDLTWSGATSTSVDIFRDGTRVMRTANDGKETDAIRKKGGGSYTYILCEAGTTTCSSQVRVSF